MRIELFWDFREATGESGQASLDLIEAKVLREILAASPNVAECSAVAKAVFGAKNKRNAVGCYVMRLRRKLGWTSILTVHGKGYRIQEGRTW